MLQKIAIKYCKGLVLAQEAAQPDHIGYSLSFISEMMAYGYMPTEPLADALANLSKTDITSLYNEVLPILKESVGAHVKHKPFYPNFPEQVMNMSDTMLYVNAMAHYFTKGLWQPNFTVNDRDVSFENTKFKMLDVATQADIDSVFTTILSSKDSISDSSKEVIKWFVEQDRTFDIPVMPFKENACLLAALFLENDMWDSRIVKDTTDVLRIATHLSGGDISLAANTKFKSFSRPIRRSLVESLERVAKEEDFVRHANKWVKLFHSLHVGDYSKSVYTMAKKLRENIKIETFNSKFEEAMACKDVTAAINLATTRPGIFARNVGRMLTDFTAPIERGDIANSFALVMGDVPSRNLTQLWGSLKTRSEEVDKRVVFPKGSIAKAYVLRNTLARIPKKYIDLVVTNIESTLHNRFIKLDELGSVYIDPAMYECPLPTGMRSASEGLKEVARGTRMPMGDKAALRFFVYWKGRDSDLSASFHDENFKLVEQISYTHLKSADIQAYHSGDITSAPRGASEFIDINIAEALASKSKIRYVVMNVLSYSGEKFNEIDTCFAGWMTRDKVKSNKIFEPKTVEQKVDLNGEGIVTIPAVFDLKERKVIWTDINTNARGFNFGGRWGTSGNNVENNRASIEETVEAFTSLDNKISLGEVFEIHANARGKIVKNKEDADFVFSFDGDVTPYDIETINSEYL